MKKSEFQKLIDQKLMPRLVALGFKKIELTDCMRPEVLYNNARLWFGTSWDYRDRYLEISLGHLYWFKDVMPRVIILGNYSSYSSRVASLPTNGLDDLQVIIEYINNSLETAIATYNERYEAILQSYLHPKKGKYTKEFILHLGSEVTKEELAKYMT